MEYILEYYTNLWHKRKYDEITESDVMPNNSVTLTEGRQKNILGNTTSNNEADVKQK